MATPFGDLMSDGLAAPLGEVIAAVGRGVADAQSALDRASLEQTLAVYESDGDDAVTLLREIGYRPTFYVLPETSCEVQVSMRLGGNGGPDGSAGTPRASAGVVRTYVTPVDAAFASRYAYQAQAAAKLTFKIVPIPPPAALDEGRPVPNLLGRPVADAVQKLEQLGFVVVSVDSAGQVITPERRAGLIVRGQDTSALSLRRIGATITLTLAAS